MTRKSSTLDDLDGHRQPVRSAILATSGLLVTYSSTRHTIICYMIARVQLLIIRLLTDVQHRSEKEENIQNKQMIKYKNA